MKLCLYLAIERDSVPECFFPGEDAPTRYVMEREPERFLVITPENLELAVGPNREVIVRLRGLEKEAGLSPDLGVMLGLSTVEARQFAAAQNRTADNAEAGLPRA